MEPAAAFPPTPLPVAARFALIMDGLRAAVAGRIGYYAVTGPMIIYICNRLSRINRTFQALAALILAGKLPAGRVHRPRSGDETAPVSPRDPEAPARRDFFPIWRWVPTYRFAWLCLVAPNWAGPRYASVYGAALRDLLGDTEMAALLAATPRMAKLLRPLCWALGIEASVLRPRPAPSPPMVDAVPRGEGCSPCLEVCCGAGVSAPWAETGGARAAAGRMEASRRPEFFARA